ncbi:MAG: hypothetical protein AB1420_16810 [Bacillota bacterium]
MLQNVLVKGLLNLTPGIGNGTVTLKGVTVQGKVLVSGGGANSVIFEDCVFDDEVIIDRKDGRVRVAAQGSTKIRIIRVEAGSAKLEESSLAGDSDGFINVYITSGEEVELEGDFEEVSVQTPGSRLNLVSGTIKTINVEDTAVSSTISLGANTAVTTININTAASITGSGAIGTAVVNAENVTIEQTPTKVELGDGISSVSVAGEEITEATDTTQPAPEETGAPSTGGGGGGVTRPNTYILTLEAFPEAGGSVTDNTNTGPYTAGATVSVNAEANEGYQFINCGVTGW